MSWGGSRKRPQAGRVLGAWRGQDAVHRGAGAAADATPRIEWTFGLRKCRLGTHWRPSFSSSPAWLPPTPRNARLPGDPSSRPRVWHVRWLRTVSSHTPPAPLPRRTVLVKSADVIFCLRKCGGLDKPLDSKRSSLFFSRTIFLKPTDVYICLVLAVHQSCLRLPRADLLFFYVCLRSRRAVCRSGADALAPCARFCRAPLRAGLVTALLPCPCARVRAGGGGASAGEGTHGYVLARPATALLTVCFSHSPANGGPGAPRAPRAHHACRDCPPGGAQASLHHPWV